MSIKASLGAGALVLMAALTACGAVPGAAAPSTPTAATTPAAGGSAASGSFQRGPAVAGMIQSVNGSTITVQTSQNGGNRSATIEVNGSTTFRKQMTETIADVKPGMGIVAVGQQNGNIFDARQIQVRSGQGGPGQGRPGSGAAGNGNGGNGGPGVNGGPGRNGAAFVGGTVDSVTGNTISVKTAAGSTVSVQLDPNGRIVGQASASASDLKSGEYIVPTGQKQGDTLMASAVNLSDSPPNRSGNASG